MTNLKKILCISLGSIIVVLGIGIVFIAALIGNVSLTSKLIGILGGVFLAFSGWWLARRGSASVWEAINWLLITLIP